uniref:Selectin P n=1 Tax=Anser cygnoides TaxID=8845 RepID=A0A8B9EMP0_ANSCY
MMCSPETWGTPGRLLGANVGSHLAFRLWSAAWTYSYSNQGIYSWEQARNYCRTFFTDLVAIQNKEEIGYLNATLPFHKQYYWIGIRKQNSVWTWVGTNKALTKEAENWAKGEPNNRRSNQDCVEIYIKRQQEAGKWNDEPCHKRKTALCYKAVACPELAAPKSGQVNCSHPHGASAFSSTCDFSCQEGFEVTGSERLWCTAGGAWSGAPPHCKAITCPMLRAPEHGQMNCSHLYGSFTFTSTCAFSCQPGFELKGSQTGLLRCQAMGNWTSRSPVCKGTVGLRSPASCLWLGEILLVTTRAVVGLLQRMLPPS